MDKSDNRYFEIQYSGLYTIYSDSSTTCGTTGGDVPSQLARETGRPRGGEPWPCEGRVATAIQPASWTHWAAFSTVSKSCCRVRWSDAATMTPAALPCVRPGLLHVTHAGYVTEVEAIRRDRRIL